MCNRYALSVPAASLFPRYNATQPANPVAAPTPELFPRKPAYVVRDADGVRIIDVMAWGFPMMTKGKSGKDIRKDVTNVRNLSSPFGVRPWQTPHGVALCRLPGSLNTGRFAAMTANCRCIGSMCLRSPSPVLLVYGDRQKRGRCSPSSRRTQTWLLPLSTPRQCRCCCIPKTKSGG